MRSKNIKKAAILILRNNNGVDWKAVNGEVTTVIIALIIPKAQAKKLHLDVLSTLTIKLVRKDFRKKLKLATTAQEIISLISDETMNNTSTKVEKKHYQK